MNLLFADLSQYILLGVLIVVIVLFFVYSSFRTKKEQEKAKLMADSLKKGDKVVTTAGVFGKIVDIETNQNYKLVILETGNAKNKGYMAIDISQVLCLESELRPNLQSSETVKQEPEENIVEEKSEVISEEVEIKPAKEKKKTKK